MPKQVHSRGGRWRLAMRVGRSASAEVHCAGLVQLDTRVLRVGLLLHGPRWTTREDGKKASGGQSHRDIKGASRPWLDRDKGPGTLS